MKFKKLPSCLLAITLTFLLGFGSTACMVTGLKLPVDLGLLACGCALGATIAAICFSLRRGGLILGAIAAVYALFMFFSYRFWNELRAMCYSALTYYNRGYGIPIPDWAYNRMADSQLTPLLLIAGIVMTAGAWTILRRKPSFLAVAAALLPLATCLVVTDTVPEVAPIFMLLLGLIILIMTQSVRRIDEIQGNKLTMILLLPVAAALFCAILFVPRSGYDTPSQSSTFQNLIDWITLKLPAFEQTSEGELVISIGSRANTKVDLTRVGHRAERNTPVMELSTSYTGILYLRGRDYDIYTGTGWESTIDRTEGDYGIYLPWYSEVESIGIRVLGRRGQYYLPCYPTEAHTLTGGMVPNPDFANAYTYNFAPLRSDWQELHRRYSASSLLPPASVPENYQTYIALPDHTRQRANSILAQLDLSDAVTIPNLAETIGTYVSGSATYDLSPSRMPGSETDFAMWFLEQSDKGYCVHFASAATVLLRAAGIPARYVEGYTVTTDGSQTTVVRERMAHAWVEYYVAHIGWVILDPTPSSAEEDTETSATDTTTTEEATIGSTAATSPRPTQSTTPTSDPQPSFTEESSTSIPGGSASVGTGSTGGTAGDSSRTVPQWFRPLLTVLMIGIGCVLALLGQWGLRRYLKIRRMHRGSPNKQALSHYREAVRMARMCKVPVPDALTQLAEKAKFSQHQLTKDELEIFDHFINGCIQALRQQHWYSRLVCRFILAAY